ncbi:MAG: class I SAM-dependent methyltransferase [Ruminococcus sp.]|nr:class I SAM-dependent methyltransferase [Ruminococcus sp.]
MNYWNDIYWKERLAKNKEEDLDFLTDMWITKYEDIIKDINIGKCLDLGCGLGQYTKYWQDLGFDCLSTDISPIALSKVQEKYPHSKTMIVDMHNDLPFKDNTFDLVFANLSIHYFNDETTKNLLKEIKRVLKPNGYFIGSVNSTKTFKFIKDNAIKIEHNYYKELDRYVRLWEEKDFSNYFKDLEKISLKEITTERWHKIKIMWEFIYQNKEN